MKPTRTWPSIPTPTHTRPSDLQFSRCTLLSGRKRLPLAAGEVGVVGIPVRVGVREIAPGDCGAVHVQETPHGVARWPADLQSRPRRSARQAVRVRSTNTHRASDDATRLPGRVSKVDHGRGASRSERRTVGSAETAVAQGQEARQAADMAPAAADRRHTVPGPHRHPPTGRSQGACALGPGVRPVPPLAAKRHLAADRHPTSGPG